MIRPRRRSLTIVLMGLAFVAGDGLFSAPVRAGIAEVASNSEPPEFIDPADTLELTNLQQRFEAIARKVSPSVVSISALQSDPDEIHLADYPATRPATATATQTDLPPMRSDEMNSRKLQTILDQSTRTVGTGFVVGSDGFILTNEHVVGQATQLWVTTSDHKVFPAFVVGSDPRGDIAVLKIPARDLTPVNFAANAELLRGQWTIAMGNPYGLATDGESCMSVGVVAATDRSLPRLAVKEDRIYSSLVQTTAQINPGNSGGPLFDLDGRVIGINTAVILPQKQTNGIGFAIPITTRLVAEVHDLEAGGDIAYGYLGVTVTDPTAQDRTVAGVALDSGVRVEATEPDSPASAAAIQSGDFLVSLDAQNLHDTDQFVRAVGDCAVGKSIQIGLVRNGKHITAVAIPKRRPLGVAAITHDTERLRWRGMLIGPIPASASDSPAKSKSGLLVLGIDDASPLKKDGVAQGSIISTVAGRPITSLAQLLDVINDVPSEKCTVGLESPATQP